MIEAGNGESIVLTSSAAGLKGMARIGHHVTAKHGVVGLMRSLAVELGRHSIRVDSVHPTGVDTPMVINDFTARFTASASEQSNMYNLLPVGLVEPVDIANAVLWLASDEARYVTGVALPVDAGMLQK
jgi:NAD(P)-dependent dehydrogenase (short-subunit alcohol dehydrogenase family)